METTYAGIERLVEGGATLDEVEAYIEARAAGSTEEARSAAWLRDWHEAERPKSPATPGLQPLE